MTNSAEARMKTVRKSREKILRKKAKIKKSFAFYKNSFKIGEECVTNTTETRVKIVKKSHQKILRKMNRTDNLPPFYQTSSKLMR